MSIFYHSEKLGPMIPIFVSALSSHCSFVLSTLLLGFQKENCSTALMIHDDFIIYNPHIRISMIIKYVKAFLCWSLPLQTLGCKDTPVKAATCWELVGMRVRGG